MDEILSLTGSTVFEFDRLRIRIRETDKHAVMVIRYATDLLGGEDVAKQGDLLNVLRDAQWWVSLFGSMYSAKNEEKT